MNLEYLEGGLETTRVLGRSSRQRWKIKSAPSLLALSAPNFLAAAWDEVTTRAPLYHGLPCHGNRTE